MLDSTRRLALTTLTLLTLAGCGTPGLPVSTRLTSQATTAPVMPPVHLRVKQAVIEVAAQELDTQFKSILALSDEKRLTQTVLTPLDGHSLQLTGRVKAAGWVPEVPFSVKGDLTVQPHNVLRFTPTDIRVAGIPFKGMMDILGIELANIAKFKDRWGRIVQSGNDIDLVIEKFTSDAVIEGVIQDVRTAASGVTVIF